MFAAGSQESTRRMELGNDGVEPAADGEDGGAPDGGLSGAKRKKGRPGKPLSNRRCDAVAATKDRSRTLALPTSKIQSRPGITFVPDFCGTDS